MSFNHFAYFAYIVIGPLTALVLGVLVFFVWPHRRMTGISYLIASLMLTISATLSNTIELVLNTPQSTLIASHITYLFAAFFPVTFFLFTLEYVRPPFLRFFTGRYFLLYIIPFGTVIFAFWPQSGMLWREYTFNRYFGLLAIDVLSYGPWFWVHVLYAYILTLTGWTMLAVEYVARRNTARRTSRLTLAGALVAIIANILYILRLMPTSKDYTAVFTGVSLLLITLGVLRERLFSLRPLAAFTITDNLHDGILLLDEHDIIIDVNQAAEALLRRPAEQILGQEAQAIVGHFAANGEVRETLFHASSEKPLHCELQCLPVTTRSGDPIGSVIVLHDISTRKAYEQMLIAHVERINNLYEANAALLRSTTLDDVLHVMVQKARYLLPNCQRTIWYPLMKGLPDYEISSPAGLEIPPLNLGEQETAAPLPTRLIESVDHIIYLQPVQTGKQCFGVLAFEWPRDHKLSPEDRKTLDNYALTSAAALQNAIYHTALEEADLTDPLTGMLNREGLHQLAQKRIFANLEQEYAILHIDLDNLARINQLYGRAAGDKALQTVGQLIQNNLRTGDVVSRYGDDDFIIVLPQQNTESAQRIARRLQTQLTQKRINHQGNSFYISISIGLAAVAANETLEAALERSTRALQRAKQQGRNRIIVAQ